MCLVVAPGSRCSAAQSIVSIFENLRMRADGHVDGGDGDDHDHDDWLGYCCLDR